MKLFFILLMLGLCFGVRSYAQDYSVNTNCTTPFEDISVPANLIVLSDDQTRPLTLPFIFQFYDRSYSDIRISNNGGILFGTSTVTLPSVNTSLPINIAGYDPYAVQAALFPHWDDLGADIGNIYTTTTGSAPNRRFIIQWNDRNLINSSCSPIPNCGISFQVVLYEGTGNFAFVYKDLIAGGLPHDNAGQATIGIQRDRNSARQLSFDNATYMTGRSCVTFTRLLTNENAMRYGVKTILCPASTSYINIGSVNNLNLSDNQVSLPLVLPFSFNYYGKTYKKIRVSNNGHIYMDDDSPSAWYSERLDIYQTDIDQDRAGVNGSPIGGGVFTGITTIGGVQVFVIEWRNLPAYPASNSGYYFQLHLFENGRITYVYKDLCASTTAVSTGSYPYRSYGYNTNIGLNTSFTNQIVFSHEPAIQIDGDLNPNDCYCLDFFLPSLNYNNMPSCGIGNTASVSGSSTYTGPNVQLLNGSGFLANGLSSGYVFSINSPESYQLTQSGSVLVLGIPTVPNYTNYGKSQTTNALSPTFSLPRSPRAQADVFPNDTVCSTEYAVLFASNAGLTAPSYQWSAGAQTTQAIRADSTATYRVTITDQHTGCRDTISKYIVKSPNLLVQSVLFDKIAVGQLSVNLDTILLRVMPDSLLYVNSATPTNFPREYEGNYVANIASKYQFSPPQATVGVHNVTVAVTDTLNGCIHSLAGQLQVLPNPQFLGLNPIYCGNITTATILRDSANYAYLDTIIGYFATNLPAPDNIQFIRVRRNRMTVAATNYAGVFPVALDANSFAFNPSLVMGASVVTCTYETQIQVLNVANQIKANKSYIAGQRSFNIQVGTDPTVNILDSTTLYCEYNNYSRVRVTPFPDTVLGTGSISLFTITNLANNTTSSIIPNSLGEVYINPSLLDTATDGNTNFRLVYTYSKLGCTRHDTVNILIPEPINASFTSSPATATYCSSSLPVQLIPAVDTSDTRVNRNNTFFFIDNISVPDRTFRPGEQLNPTYSIVGPHTIRYEIQDTFGCQNQSEQIYSVNGLTTPTIGLNNTQYCADTLPQSINVTIAPTINGTGVLWQTTRAGGRIAVPFTAGNSPNFTANPDLLLGNQTVSDTISYRYVFTNANGCTDSVTATATINTAPVISFTNLPVSNCLDTSLRIPLNASPVGVVIQMPGINNNNFDLVNAVFSPRTLVSNQLVSYYYNNTLTGCVKTVYDTVTIISDNTTFAFTTGLPNYICKADSTPLNLVVAHTDTSSSSIRTFSSNRIPNGLTSLGGRLNFSTDTVRFIPSRSDTGNVIISYTAVLGGVGCSKTIRDTIYVHRPAPIFLEFIEATNGDSICEFGKTVIFIQNYPQSSVPLSPRLDTIRGANAITQQGVQRLTSIRYDFLPNSITAANRLQWHNVIANVTDNYGCAVSVTDSIKVIANPIPFINGLNNSYCLNSGLDTITGAPQNGNWYNITAGIKYGLPSIQMASIRDTTAIPMGSINPLVAATGGTFIFTPNTIDTTTIIYEVQYANGCINRDSQNVIVYPLPNLVIDPLPTLICSNNPNIPLTATVNSTPVHFPDVSFRESPTVAGGIVVDTSFSPSALIPGPISDVATRTIIASYSYPNSGCTDKDTLNVTVRRPPNANILNLSPASCVNTLPNTIAGENTDMVAMAAGIDSATFSSRDIGVITQISNTSATFTPSLITNGSDTVTYTVTAPNGCSDAEVRIIVSNNLPNGLSTTMNSRVYCENGTVVPIAGLPIPNAPAVGSFSVINSANTRLDTSNNNSLNLKPTDYADSSGIGIYSLIYRYQDLNGCVNFDTTRFEIHPRPNASFSQSSFCIGDTIQLRDNSTFAATLNNADTLRFWNWAYQGQAYSNNTAYFLDLFNLPAGRGTAQLVATSGAGCKDTTQQDVRIFNNPRVRFSTTGGCTGATVDFHSDSTFLIRTIDTVSSALWDFGDGTTLPASISNNTIILPTNHTYNTAGIYFPSLFIANQGYCIGSDTLRIAISPKVDPSILPYVENFEQTDGSWFQSLPNNQAIWTWGVANKTHLTDTATGNKSWITGLRITGTNPNNGAYPQNADTWIYGPCFDFTNSIKPMVKLDIAADMYSYDGVVLQYFNNNTSRWSTIGRNERGVNWYNNPSALGLYDYDPSQPYDPNSSSLNAWSGSIGFIGSNNATTMQTARYRLDELKGQDNIQIRISFGGLNTPNLSNKEGFMFDNVWIGERRRNVLVEHFASQNHLNMGVSTTHLNNLIFNQHNVHDVVLVEYHTEISPDALFFDSPAGNSARRLYYGANNAEVAVDGNAWLGQTLALTMQPLDNDMLQDPDFSINRLNLSINQANNTATIRAEVRAEKNLPTRMQYQIYPCFVEDSLSWLTQLGFVNQMGVFRQFAPSASGLNHERSWQIGDTIFVEQTWNIDIATLNINCLEGIVFIQDSRRKVLQAAQTRNLNVFTLPQFPVSIEHLEQAQAQGREIFNLNLYPNPAVDFTTLAFDAPLTQDYQFEVYDAQGRLLQRGKLNQGSQQEQIDVADYAAGMYIVAIFDQERSVLTRRKFVVSRP